MRSLKQIEALLMRSLIGEKRPHQLGMQEKWKKIRFVKPEKLGNYGKSMRI